MGTKMDFKIECMEIGRGTTVGAVTKDEKRSAENPSAVTEETVSVKVKGGKGYLLVKRVFDIVAALVLGVLLLIPMLIVALLIKLDSPGPVVFKQDRMGKDGEVFTIYKFRTMRIGAPGDVAARAFSDSDAYITRIGGLLRRSSIDELPQLINVLAGDMSIVGYRPVCLTEVEVNEMRRQLGVFSVRPGITGLAQVSGRNTIDNEQKVQLDAQYVRECSLKMDLYCLAKTVTAVLDGEGVA